MVNVALQKQTFTQLEIFLISALILYRSSLQEVFCEKCVLRSLPQVFTGEFCEISKNTFFIENLRWLPLTVNLSREKKYEEDNKYY